MTSIYLENGGQLGVYGDVEVSMQNSEVTVNIRGEIVEVSQAGTMQTLPKTHPVTICTDQFPGKVIYTIGSKSQAQETEILQIPHGLHTVWILSKEDGDVVNS